MGGGGGGGGAGEKRREGNKFMLTGRPWGLGAMVGKKQRGTNPTWGPEADGQSPHS